MTEFIFGFVFGLSICMALKALHEEAWYIFLPCLLIAIAAWAGVLYGSSDVLPRSTHQPRPAVQRTTYTMQVLPGAVVSRQGLRT